MNDSPAPVWVETLKQSYLSGAASMFILHGNVSDAIGSADGPAYVMEQPADFMARRLFGDYDLVLHYDLGRGLRAYAANDPQRLTRMQSLLTRILGADVEFPRDPTQALRMIDRIVSLLLVSEGDRARKVAVILDYAELICGPDERTGEHLATLLNWARSPVIRRVNLLFLLLTESLAQMNPVLVQSGHTAEIHIPLPTEAERKELISKLFKRPDADATRLSVLSAGLTLTNLHSMMRTALGQQEKPAPDAGFVKESDGAKGAHAPAKTDDHVHLSEIKKALMEAQCPGLIEFVRPSANMSMVAGHTAAKERLLNDASLVRDGHLDAIPMGYLICGPVGVGKTFLALCYAAEVGIPCLVIRNFRSKYVGETESNLERILGVVRELGPVAVIIDEADAAVGNRGASGDSGTSARVFAQLASQMGDTRYRGRIIWFLLTCRPDLLPIDLKRQGRCEEHIPLFYPQSADELRDMFLAMGKKLKLGLTAESLPDLSGVPSLSGADIEGVLTRARRESLLRKAPLDAAIIGEVLGNFRSVRSTQHELQWLAAIMECSDLRYLPEDVRKVAEKPEGFATLERRFQELLGPAIDEM
ncbi:MAG: ATP-binding protein [Candidatus Hydrogenedentes bacterium]|nr:ATP-binding protein [Candidatus Hydrogenedentota bacterium]